MKPVNNRPLANNIDNIVRVIVGSARFDVVNHTIYVGTLFGKGHSHPEHYQMSYVISGRSDVVIGGQRCHVCPGRVVWIPPETLHYSCRPEARERFELAQTKFYISPEPRFQFPVMMTVQAPQQWLTLFQQMLNEYHSQRYCREIALRLLLAQLVLLMAEGMANGYRRGIISKSSDRARTQRRAKINQAISYLHNHYGESLGLKDIAAHVGMSVSALSHEFRLVTGLAPINYLINYRLSQAAVLLGDHRLKISAVADAVGFNSPYYFCRQFKKRYYASPRAYYRKIFLAR